MLQSKLSVHSYVLSLVGMLGFVAFYAQDPAPTSGSAVPPQQNSLEIVRGEIATASNTVSVQRAKVDAVREQATAVEKHLEPMLQDRQSLQIRLERAESLLVIRQESAGLVQRQLAQKAQTLTVTATTSRNAAREIEAYRKEALASPKKFAFAKEIAELKKEQATVLALQKKLHNALQAPIEKLRTLQSQIGQEELALAETQARLSELKLQAGARLNGLAPPYLQQVRLVDAKDRVIYDATWKELPAERSERIRRLGTLLGSQLKLLGSRERQLTQWSEILLAQDKECAKILAESQDSSWRQYWETITREVCEELLTNIWGGENRSSYDIGLEGADRMLRSAHGKPARTFEPIGSLSALAILPPKAERALRERDWSAVKTEISQEVHRESAETRSKRYREAEMEGLNKVWATTLDLPMTARAESFVEAMTNANAQAIWKSKAAKIDEIVLKRANERMAGTDYIPETRVLRKSYAQVNARRAIAIAYFRATAVLRRADRRILTLMQQVMDEEISTPGSRGLDRLLERRVDQQITRRTDYTLQLTFSKPVLVNSVTLAGTSVPTSHANGRGWQGKVRLDNYPKTGQLLVDASDPSGTSRLDDPTTRPEFLPGGEASWIAYEPGLDSSHLFRTVSRAAKRSIVLIVDLNENGESTKARALKLFNFAGGLARGDELALFAVQGETVSRVIDFTQETSVVRDHIKSLTSGSPEVPAWAITSAGRYLYTRGRGAQKSIKLFTGHQTVGLKTSLETLRKMRKAERATSD